MTNNLVDAIVSGDLISAKELFEQTISKIISEKLETMKTESLGSFECSDPIVELADIVKRSTLNRRTAATARKRQKTNAEVQSKLSRIKQSWSSSLRAHLPSLLDDTLTQMNMRYQLEI